MLHKLSGSSLSQHPCHSSTSRGTASYYPVSKPFCFNGISKMRLQAALRPSCRCGVLKYAVQQRRHIASKSRPDARKAESWNSLKPGTDEYYEWFFRLTVKCKDPWPNEWIYDPNVKGRSILLMKEHPRGLLRVFEDPNTDLELAGKCLEAFVIHAHSSSQWSRPAARKYLVTSNAGTKI